VEICTRGTARGLHRRRTMTPHDIEDLEEELATTTFDRAEILRALVDRPGLAVPPPPPRRTPIPPPLPVALRKRVTYGDEEWLASLPAEKRAVLEAAMQPARPWPYAERIDGAVCTPIA
jgi:hypothetical protein